MPTLPGPNESATLALGLVDDLIALLVRRNIITEEDRTGLWADLATRLGDDVTKLRKDSAAILRERIDGQE